MNWCELLSDLCHFYPGYTVDRLMVTPIPVIRALADRIPELLKFRGM